MSSEKSPMNKNNTTGGIQTRASDSSSGNHPETSYFSEEVKENDNAKYSQDEQERHERVKAQQEEIRYLQEQITLASVKERQLLNEKYALERKFAELRLALDEKQNEAIASASNELARRKGDLEENLRLTHELKVAEDERYTFVSSLVGLLAEYGILPRVTNAAALSDSVKHLRDQMQQKIRASHARMGDTYSTARIQTRNGSVDKNTPENNLLNGLQMPMGQRFSPSPYSNSVDGRRLEPAYVAPRYTPEHDYRQRDINLMTLSASKSVRQNANYVYDYAGVNNRSLEKAEDNYFQSPTIHDEADSLILEEDGPGIDGFQIIGDAKPGGKLLGCGFPVRGTSLCMFQWVRHLQDGTREYIEGATNPEYLVTADDVDKLVAVECIPMDDQGRQGEIVRFFANEQNKITCDPEMQQEIDGYMAAGQALFNVLLLMDFAENWDQTTLALRRSGYHIKVNRTQENLIKENYSNVSIKIPPGLTAQFVLTSNGSSYPFNTYNDVRKRDALVLTMRMFQNKALDERRKGKAWISFTSYYFYNWISTLEKAKNDVMKQSESLFCCFSF